MAKRRIVRPFGDPYPAAFYNLPAETVAPRLVGAILVRRIGEALLVARIVETEAYLSADDPACHAYKRRTVSNGAMFGPPGRAYVYPIHAKWCMNAVTEAPDLASAVLIRAAEPLLGEELMQERRPGAPRRDWLRGPARLCLAFAIDRSLDHADLTVEDRLWISPPSSAASPTNVPADTEIAVSPRIGITQGVDLPLRFFLRHSPFVSGLKRWHAVPLSAFRPDGNG